MRKAGVSKSNLTMLTCSAPSKQLLSC